ncbi:uncharacterized protein LOC128394484 [Panonychus citri]|uniref:uncharacterized protein LOC128394484 n=1 Tax=Panonychus citri TaxID=50023 RepID=UPI002307BFD3|nr:uncharacterized protein LOC128394484 [Panonychus citri]
MKIALNYSYVLILCLLFVSTEALVDTWSLTSSDGLTSCNYSYLYRKDRDFDGAEEVISDTFECGDGSATCTSTLRFNKTFMTQYKGDDDLDPRNFENFMGRVGTLANKAGLSFTDSRLKDGTFSCTINPGYRVQIITKPRYHRLTGTLEERCLTSCSGCIESIRSVPLKIEIPVKSNSDNQIAGSISCKVEPAANIEAMTRICNPKKMTSGKMFDAVGDALHKVMTNTPLNRVKTLEHTNIDGNDVWAIGMCWNGLNRDACRACVRYLVDNIWSECENSKGGQLWVTDCGVRYEFHRLTASNYEDSFLEQS